MKRIYLSILATAALAANAADTRLPEYGQVAGVSNQVMAVDAKISSLTPSASYPQTCAITFTIGGTVPTGTVAEQMLPANIKLTAGNNVYRYPLISLAVGTTVSTRVSVTGTLDAYVELELNDSLSTEQYLYSRTYKRIANGGNYAIAITLRRADRDLFAVGRFQRINQSGESDSWIITRDCSSTNNYTPTTLYGHFEYSGTQSAVGTATWIDDTGLLSADVPTVDSTGAITAGAEGVFEQRIFPWCAVEKRVVTSGFSDNTARNDYKFTWCPLYYWKQEDLTLDIVNHYQGDDTWVTNATPCRVHWISKTALPGYSLPPWAYRHEYDQSTATWSASKVKDGFYYACYKSVTKNNWMQSYPWAATDTGHSRGAMHTLSAKNNQYATTVSGGSATNIVYAAGDSRLWSGTGYESYAPWRELAYIQFGVDFQSAMCIGGFSTGQSKMSDFDGHLTSGLKTFKADGTSSGAVWLNIVNPFCISEGEQMADATVLAICESNTVTAAISKYYAYYVCPDRAMFLGDSSDITALENNGYIRLNYVTSSGWTGFEGYDTSSPQTSIYWFPCNTTYSWTTRPKAVDSSYYSGLPATPSASPVYRMCSLSDSWGGRSALGMWYVCARSAPSVSSADCWGSRPSFAPVKAEGEARSDE